MDIDSLLKGEEEIPGESLEDKIDRINLALQNTMQEIEIADHHRMPSMASYLHSCTTSYCQFEWFDAENETSAEVRLPEGVEETLEKVLLTLDRAQMSVEDFWAESLRSQISNKSKNDEIENYILKLEKENRDLRTGKISGKANIILNLRRNDTLELERKNFEEKLNQLDILNDSYKFKHAQMAMLQENLKIKESLLEQKEKELRTIKNQFEQTKKNWEQSIISNTMRNDSYEKALILQDTHTEEAPPPALVMTPNRGTELAELQQELKCRENDFQRIESNEEKSKAITYVDQLKNKIAALRSAQAIVESTNSCRLIKNMRLTMEKEVYHEENLRKLNLEKYSIKGPNRLGEQISVTPSYSSLNSKRFLFADD